MGLYDNFGLQKVNYIPTYQGAPIQEFQKSADVLQNRYYENLAKANATDLALGMGLSKVADEDKQNYTDLIAKPVKNALSEMAKSGDYEWATGRVSSIANRFMTDPIRLAMEENKAKKDEYVKTLQTMRENGHTPLDFTPSWQGTVNPDGTINPFNHQVEARKDWEGRASDLWNNIKPDGYDLKPDDVKNGILKDRGFMSTGTWEGISNQKIKKMFADVRNNYMNSEEGQQQFKWYAYQLKKAGLTDQNALMQAQKEIDDNLLSRGMLERFGISHATYQQYKKGAGEDDSMGPGDTEQLPTPQSVSLKDMLGFNPKKFDPENPASTASPAGSLANVGGIGPMGGFVATDPQPPSPQETEKYDKLVQAAADTFGKDASKLNDKDKYALVNDYLETQNLGIFNGVSSLDYPREREFRQIKKSDVTKQQMNKMVADELENQLPQGTRVVYDRTDGKILTGDEVQKVWDGTPGHLQVAGESDPRNMYARIPGGESLASSYIVGTTDKAGNHHNLVVSKSLGYQKKYGNLERIENKVANNLLFPNFEKEFDIEGRNGKLNVAAKRSTVANQIEATIQVPEGGRMKSIKVTAPSIEDFSTKLAALVGEIP